MFIIHTLNFTISRLKKHVVRAGCEKGLHKQSVYPRILSVRGDGGTTRACLRVRIEHV